MSLVTLNAEITLPVDLDVVRIDALVDCGYTGDPVLNVSARAAVLGEVGDDFIEQRYLRGRTGNGVPEPTLPDILFADPECESKLRQRFHDFAAIIESRIEDDHADRNFVFMRVFNWFEVEGDVTDTLRFNDKGAA